MRTKNSKLPSAKPQIALLAMALVISSGAVYAQAHRGQVSTSNPTQAVQSSQSTQSVTTSTNSSFTQPAPSTSKGTTHSHRSTLLQIVGGAHGDDDGENGDD
jgi:cytoskeletal protein RodZ